MSNWNEYDNNISDHRPVGIKLEFGNISSEIEVEENSNKLLKIVDVLAREVNENTKGLLFYIYDNGTVVKKIIME